MEGKAAGVNQSTLQHCKRFHNLSGIHFIESLNGHGGWELVGEDEVVIWIFQDACDSEACDSFPGRLNSIYEHDRSRNCYFLCITPEWLNVELFNTQC